VVILLIIGILLASCTPATATLETEVVNEIATEDSAAKAPITQEPVVTEKSAATEPPMKAPIEPLPACVTLLTPINGVEIPPAGKATFSWTALDEAEKYVLNIIFPSGEIVSIETDQTFRDRYMESFIAGGEYQWQVVVQGANESEICVSDVAAFNKSVYQQPKNSGTGGSSEGGNNDVGGCAVDCTPPGGGGN
jgi:hypothetical protein